MTLFSGDVAEKLCAHLSEQLVKEGKTPERMNAECYKIVATWFI
jgi:hypothetical protein